MWTQCGTVCTAGKFGWYANLPGGSEQIVSNPSLYQGGLIVNSTIPANNSLLSCTNNTDTGVTYDISVVTGGSFQTSPGVYYTGFVNYASTQMVGLQTNETGSLTALTTTENTTWLLGQAINPTPGTAPPPPTQIKQPTNVSVNRQTWVELR